MRTLRTGVCIVGSGMGAGTLALALAQRGLNPVVLEAGDIEPGSQRVTHVETGRPLGLAVTRAIEVGGSSNLWHGVTSPLDPFDFERPDADEYHTWPLPYAEMRRYWEQAMLFLGFDTPTLPTTETLPAPLAASSQDIRHDRTLFSEKIFRVLANPKRLKPDLISAADQGTLHLLTGTVAHRVERAAYNPRRITAVIASSEEGPLRVEADRFVIGAGALESPRLLLNSEGFADADRHHIGHCLMDHPMGFLGKLRFRRPTLARLFSDLPGAGRHRLRLGLVPRDPARFGNSNLYLRPSAPGQSTQVENDILLSLTALRGMRGLRPHHVATLMVHPRVAYRAVANRFALPIRYRSADLFFVMEQTPNRDSRVTLAPQADTFGVRKAAVHWQVSTADQERMARYIEEVAHHGLSDEQYRFTDLPHPRQWEQTYSSAAHHLGTLRMARHAEHGAVDPQLRCFGTDNLWVCDGSVFPTGGNANPSLTICALALRLADQLTDAHAAT